MDPAFITDIMKKLRIQEKLIRNPPQPSPIPFAQDTAFCLNLHQGKEYCEYFYNSFNLFVNKPPIYSKGGVEVDGVIPRIQGVRAGLFFQS